MSEDSSVTELSQKMGQNFEGLLSNISHLEEIFELKNHIVFKKIDTLPQAKITNRKRRLENVRGVFDIKNPENIKGKTIIIIDDVTTTGGTILEIMKILKKSGAKKVIGFAVAH